MGIHLEGSGLRVGPPEPLFPFLSVAVVSFEPRTYDVSPDGRFLIIRRASEEPESPVIVDVGWTARLISGRK